MSEETVECAECGDDVAEAEALTEFNSMGPGPDRRFFCSLDCSLQFAGGDA